MKKQLMKYGVFFFIIVFLSITVVHAAIGVSIGGKAVRFPDEKPFVDKNYRTMVPIRFISENLGYKVIWNGKTQQVTIVDANKEVVLKMNSSVMLINGKKQTMDTKLVSKSGRTFVPLRFVAQAFSAGVIYDSKTQQVKIQKQIEKPSYTINGNVMQKNEKSYSITGKGLAGATIDYEVVDGEKKTIKGKTTAKTDGTYTITLNVENLRDGSLILSVTQTKNGSTSEKVTGVIVKQSIGPSVTLLTSGDMNYNNQFAYEVSGKTIPNATVKVAIYDRYNKAATQNVQADETGVYQAKVNAEALQDGTLRVGVEAVDEKGNVGVYIQKTITKDSTIYELDTNEQAKWHVSNDGTHAIETTKGMNDALAWTVGKGITTFKVPEGTYMVKKADPAMWRDPTACINLVANLTFSLDDAAVIQKETNAKEAYDTVCIGYGADNVTLKGGTYKGDKATHDYSQKEDESTPGTHENGIGISVFGAKNLTVDGIKAIEFTGDGMGIGGKGTLIQDLYEAHFESGSLDSNGQPIADATKVRMKGSISLINDRYKDILAKEPYFELSNVSNLPGVYDVYFYKADGTFLSKYSVTKWRDIVRIPQGATSFKAVFTKSSATGAYAEFWNKALATDVVVKNSEFAYNRRQGITIGGADNVHITTSSFHDMKGTMPQSGIDAEGGYGENGMLNKNLFITNNEFYKNASYDIILYDGIDATVEGNHLASKGVFGLAVSDPFTGATIKDNHFDGSRIIAAHDVNFIGNKMNDSLTTIDGPRITFDGMEFTNSNFAVAPIVADGVSIKNVTTYNSDISVWKNPIHIENVTMYGPKAGITGSAVGNTVDNLKIYNYSLGGMSLGANTYNNCLIESSTGSIPAGASGLNLNQTGTYVFNGCNVKTSGVGFIINNKDTNVSILNSSLASFSNKSLLNTTNAKSLRLESNNITTSGIQYASDGVIVIGDYWKRNNVYDASQTSLPSVIIKGNMITNTSTSSTSVKGIITDYVGTSAPAYTVDNNTLKKATLNIKANDSNVNNVINP